MGSSKAFSADLVVATSAHAYVAVDPYALVADQLVLTSTAHCGSVLEMEEDVYIELRNWQKSVVRWFAADKKNTVFVETVAYTVSKEKAILGAGPHTVVVAY